MVASWHGRPAARLARRRRFAILPQPFEHGFAQQVVFRHRAVGHFGLDRRLHPGGFRLLDRPGQRRVLADERIEPLAQIARNRLGVAAAHLAGVEQPFAFTPTHIQRGDPARLGAELLDEGHDREGVALAALDLDPAFDRPERYGVSSCLLMMPSRPMAQARS
jgi:hypothetical protein